MSARQWMTTMATTCLLLFPSNAEARQSGVRIDLERGSEAEARMADELRALLEEYDLEPWILTRDVRIDERAIPHSHPVLTLHTRHIGDESMLLAVFLHEQLHWLEEQPWTAPWQETMEALQRLFPEVPPATGGGARDDESTYRHLLVCDLEYQALSTMVGPDRARETLARITHYEWIYERVLNDPRIREVALRNGFDVSRGASVSR